MKKLSVSHQEILDTRYPDGYVVPEGEEGHFHIMFIDIVKDGQRTRDVPVIQKYYPVEWDRMRKAIENPVIGILQTGHDEYCVLYDPIEAAALKAKKEAAEKKKAAAEADKGSEPAEAESKKPGPRARPTKSTK